MNIEMWHKLFYEITVLQMGYLQSTFGTWRMKDVNDNTIQATLFNRGYEIVVNIPYSAKGYSIKYVSASDNLKDKNGNVHRNYNRWVNNLNTKIKQNIFMSN